MRVMLVFLCSGSVLSFKLHSPLSQNHREHEDPFDDLLSGLSEKAHSEYYKIFQNQSQTLEQLEMSLECWAIKYGVEDKYRDLVAHFAKEHAELVRSLTDLSGKLTIFLRKFLKIGDNKKQTIESIFHESEELYSMLSKKEKMVTSYIFRIYDSNFGDDSVIFETGRRFLRHNHVLLRSKGRFQEGKEAFARAEGILRKINGELVDNSERFPGINDGFFAKERMLSGRKVGIQKDKRGFSGYNGRFPRTNNGYVSYNRGYSNDGL